MTAPPSLRELCADLRRSRHSFGTGTMKLLKKLYNPFLLIGQGFALGAILFLSAHPETGESIAASLSGHPAAAATAKAGII